LLGANGDFASLNLYAYCGNNPISRKDTSGHAWETVWDIISLATSVADVVANPSNPWAWAGLIGDIVDVAVPFVGGLGEAARAVNKTIDLVDAVDDIHDAGKAVDIIDDAADSYKVAVEGLCFVEGTLVHTENGFQEIEDIQPNDYVWAWDEEIETVALKKVVETYANRTSDLVHIFANGEEIITTPNHSFYSPKDGWTKAVDLNVGDALVLFNNQQADVEKIWCEKLDEPITVYNFQVEDYHTYFVTESGILVHNDCIGTPRFDDNQQAVLDLAREYKKGISLPEAEILVEWAEEYGISSHGPAVHLGRPGIWGSTLHIKIKNYHIPIYD